MSSGKSSASRGADRLARQAAHVAIRGYQLTLSSVFGRHCRYLPTCSEFTDEAIQRHGLWAGGWMGVARLWRCRPFGPSGYDPVPSRLPAGARPLAPWRYGKWRGPLICESLPQVESRGAVHASARKHGQED